jgi:hypothetical protein
MSSVGRGFASRVTNNFVANGNVSDNADAFVGGAWLVRFSSMVPVLAFFNPTYDQPFTTLKCKFVSFRSVADLVGGLNAVWNNMSVTATPYETLIDMGREINFGVKGGAADLVTFRVVQRTNGTGDSNGVGGAPIYGGGNDNGYNTYLVAVSNKLSGNELQGVFPVQVSRQ